MTNQTPLTKDTLLEVAQKEKSRQLFALIFLLIVAAIACIGFIFTRSRSTVVSMILALLGVVCVVLAFKQLLRYRKNNTPETIQAEKFEILALPVVHKDEGHSGDVAYFELYFAADMKDFVSKKEYQQAEIGDLYYVVRLHEDNRILRSFAEKRYTPEESLLPYLISHPQQEVNDLA